MKEIITTTYQCEVCTAIFEAPAGARACEAVPIDTIKVEVGAFVGADEHGWWNVDTSWTLSAVPKRGRDWMDVTDAEWGTSPRGPFSPGNRAFLPIWKIAAIDRVQCTHRLRLLLWCPRHSNRMPYRNKKDYGEALSITFSRDHVTPRIIPEKFHPVLTPDEQARFDALVAAPAWDVAGLL